MANKVITGDPAKVHPPGATYSAAIEIPPGARVVHVSGQIGVKPDGAVPEGMAEQTETAWRNVLAVLDAAGMGAADIVKVTQFIVGAENIPGYREGRARVVGDLKPASTLLVVAGLAMPQYKVEVEVVAAK